MPKHTNLEQVEYRRHELLDRISVLIDLADISLLQDALYPARLESFSKRDRKYLKKKIDAVFNNLHAAYQRVGEIHLTSPEDKK